ncbi:MAG TPA: hypothetical protein PLL26_05910 [Candidatus Dojkabacteria bacterium]|nr:hypothetical protein [Candidatus Dojkabacteria bacterium]
MFLRCSECGGEVNMKKTKSQVIYKCMNCGKEKVVKTKVVETIDMSETAGLSVIME